MIAVPDYLKAVRERCEKATEGPWESNVRIDEGGNRDLRLDIVFATGPEHTTFPEEPDCADESCPSCKAEADAEFIAASRTDVPTLERAASIMWSALEKVNNTPHLDYDYNGGGSYGTGVTDGHRLAAKWACEALAAVQSLVNGGLSATSEKGGGNA